MRGLDRLLQRLRPGDAEGGEPALIPDAPGILERDGVDIRIDALGEVPEPLTALAVGDRDLTAQREDLEELRRVAVVGPASRRPGDCRSIRDVARGEGAGIRETGEDVMAKRVVRLEPPARSLSLREGPHPGEEERKVGHGTHEGIEFEERAVDLECGREVLGPVGVAEPAPGDEVGVRCDRGGRVDLQERQPAHERHKLPWSLGGEELRGDRDAPSRREVELVLDHAEDDTRTDRPGWDRQGAGQG